jgi:magnesium-transporting ATPase (P-type)
MSNEEQQTTALEKPADTKAYTKRDLCGAIGVGFYLLCLLAISVFVWYWAFISPAPEWVKSIKHIVGCILVAVSGGVLYCLRAVYVNYSVRKQWSEVWLVWYLFRPFTSGLMGFLTYLVVKAGLFAVGSTSAEHPETLLYALSFFAGLNVDGFLKRFEGQVSNSMKVNKSRQSKGL